MNDAKVMQLFQALISLPDAEPWRDLAEAEMNAVMAELRPGADPDDSRLDFYAAARAFLQLPRLHRAVSQAHGTIRADLCGDGRGRRAGCIQSCRAVCQHIPCCMCAAAAR